MLYAVAITLDALRLYEADDGLGVAGVEKLKEFQFTDVAAGSGRRVGGRLRRCLVVVVLCTVEIEPFGKENRGAA